MKRRSRVVLSVIAFFVVLTFQNCGGTSSPEGTLYGTEIGNPAQPNPDGSTTGTAVAVFSASSISEAACGVLVKCYPALSAVSCGHFFGLASGVATALGLPPGLYDPFSQLIEAESQGEVVVNSLAASACLNEISALTCNETPVEGAYSATDTQPLINVASMIPRTPGSCPSVFSLKP